MFKILSALRSRRPLTRAELTSCAVINQFATPGLGSLLARRYAAGAGQLCLALIGFGFYVGWLVQKMRVFYGQIFGTELSPTTGHQLGKWGLLIFAAAWIWSFLTSIQILRSTPKDSDRRLPPML